MSPTPERAKELFTAIKLHFTSKYNFFNYSGKLARVAIKPQERYAIARVIYRCKTEEGLINLFAHNQVQSYWKHGRYITFFNHASTEEAFQIDKDWQVWWEQSLRNFETELKEMSDTSLADWVKIKEAGDHPKIFQHVLGGSIHFNVPLILCTIHKPFFLHWMKNSADPLFEDYLRVLQKYKPFCKIDVARHQIVLDKVFKNI